MDNSTCPATVATWVGVRVTVLVRVGVGVGDAPRYVASTACQAGLSAAVNVPWATYWACAATIQYISKIEGPSKLPTPDSAV